MTAPLTLPAMWVITVGDRPQEWIATCPAVGDLSEWEVWSDNYGWCFSDGPVTVVRPLIPAGTPLDRVQVLPEVAATRDLVRGGIGCSAEEASSAGDARDEANWALYKAASFLAIAAEFDRRDAEPTPDPLAEARAMLADGRVTAADLRALLAETPQ